MVLKRAILTASALASFAAGAASAQTQVMVEDRVVAGTPGQPARRDILVHSAGIAGAPVEFMSAEFGVHGKVVKGAPYSADAVSETVQVLADGNRITHRNSTAIARDGEGRTRRDVSLMVVGTPSAEDAVPKFSVIFDPVTNTSYTLDHNEKVARKNTGQSFEVRLHSKIENAKMPVAGTVVGGISTSSSVSNSASSANSSSVATTSAVASSHIAMPAIGMRMRHDDVKTEQLGERAIEGVLAEGTRTVHVIPAGEIGNERPIEITSERWYSPELQTVVMTRNVDPRMGETTYKLTNLRKGEPLKSLFEVPADYTVTTDMPRFRQLRDKEKE